MMKKRAMRLAQGSEGEAPASTTVSSRFAYEVLTKEDPAAKAPGARRGKDGHVSLPGLDDPFAAPAAGRAPRGAGLGLLKPGNSLRPACCQGLVLRQTCLCSTERY